ncbi:hypothetical protein ACJX0J_038633, partial [Zea mays]
MFGELSIIIIDMITNNFFFIIGNQSTGSSGNVYHITWNIYKKCSMGVISMFNMMQGMLDNLNQNGTAQWETLLNLCNKSLSLFAIPAQNALIKGNCKFAIDVLCVWLGYLLCYWLYIYFPAGYVIDVFLLDEDDIA